MINLAAFIHAPIYQYCIYPAIILGIALVCLAIDHKDITGRD